MNRDKFINKLIEDFEDNLSEQSIIEKHDLNELVKKQMDKYIETEDKEYLLGLELEIINKCTNHYNTFYDTDKVIQQIDEILTKELSGAERFKKWFKNHKNTEPIIKFTVQILWGFLMAYLISLLWNFSFGQIMTMSWTQGLTLMMIYELFNAGKN